MESRPSPSEGDSSTGWERRGGGERKRARERETRQTPEGLMEDCSRAPGGRVLLASAPPEKVAGHRRRCGVRGRADQPHWEMLSTALLEVETELWGWGPCLRSPLQRTGEKRRGQAAGGGADRGPGRRHGGRAEGLGELGPQEPLDGRVDVPSGGDQRLQVGFPVDEAHGVELLQLLLKSHLRRLHL